MLFVTDQYFLIKCDGGSITCNLCETALEAADRPKAAKEKLYSETTKSFRHYRLWKERQKKQNEKKVCSIDALGFVFFFAESRKSFFPSQNLEKGEEMPIFPTYTSSCL